MIYDTFSFFNELDLLEIRLNELNDVVDKFVICEANFTHSGLYKPFNFADHLERFEKFNHKICYLPYQKANDSNSWKNEYNQRNYISNTFTDLKDDDIIILSDLDEIPNKEILENLKVEDGKIYNLIQKLYFYYLNVKCTNIIWTGSQIFKLSTFRNSGNCLTDFRRSNNLGFQSKNCNVPKVNVDNGGWHFSYLGGIDKVKEKMKSFMHQEMVSSINLNNIENIIHNLGWPYKEHKVDLQKVEIDASYPKYLLDNLEKYKHLLK